MNLCNKKLYNLIGIKYGVDIIKVFKKIHITDKMNLHQFLAK